MLWNILICPLKEQVVARGWRVGCEEESGSSDFFSVALADKKLPGK